MAAPVVTARTIPAGPFLDQGMRITICFANSPALNIEEVDPMPFGLDGGEPADITTQFNLVTRTKYPRFLIECTETEYEAAYNPAVLTTLLSIINKNTSITFHFPDHSAWAVWGFLRKAVPDKFEDGKQPRMKITITPTNYDDVNAVEAVPIYQAAAGTP